MPGAALVLGAVVLALPTRPWVVFISILAGVLTASADHVRASRRCTIAVPDATEVRLRGYFETRAVRRRAEFRIEGGLPGGCQGRVDASLRVDSIPVGREVEIEGWWRGPDQSLFARPLVVVERVRAGGGSEERGARAWLPAVRSHAQDRVDAWFGDAAPVVDALLLANRGRLDPDVREAFARSGTAHLLAISGFHVGVIAGLLFAGAALAGLAPRGRMLVCCAGTWGYVALIGAPHSAARAALLLTCVAGGHLRGQPAHRWGGLATALLVLLLWSPESIRSPGLQLSFAGAAGLLAWRSRFDGALDDLLELRAFGPVRKGLAAGLAATIPTMPLVAWHFDEVSTIGVPMTLVSTSLVATIVVGVLATLVAGTLSAGVGHALGGGVEWLVAMLLRGTAAAAHLPGASVWVSRPLVLGALVGAVVGWLLTASRRRSSVFPTVLLMIAGAVIGPLVEQAVGAGRLEIVTLDVGQGDALAIRSPGGRWLLVDAGPRSARFDAGHQRVVPFLRRRGAREVEALFLTHPDLDHIGGAVSVLEEMRVHSVIGPAVASARPAHLRTIAVARGRGTRWVAATSLGALELDGMTIEVLWPDSSALAEAAPSNERSVVFHLRFGDFAALFTGDASSDIEGRLLRRLPDLDVLKVGHHGSATSTSLSLLERARPEVALISAGRGNRYGHPHPTVLNRLDAVGARILRTDRHGTVRVVADGRGQVRVRAERSPWRIP